VWSGGEGVLREIMAILDITAQEVVSLMRSTMQGGPTDTTAASIAEAVMGSAAWNTYKNAEYKSMHGPRKPEGSAACAKRVKERKLKLKGSLAGWTLQHEPEHFAGTDTRWTMGQILTWLPPDGDVNHMHLETLGNMIAEAFHQHKIKVKNAKTAAKKTSTAAEASD